MGLTNGPRILPMKMRGRFSRPEAMSMVAEQCAIICATSIFPHCLSDAGCSLSMRAFTSSTVSRSNRFFIFCLQSAPLASPVMIHPPNAAKMALSASNIDRVMRTFAVISLLTLSCLASVLAYAQTGTEPPPRAALPPENKSSVNLNDSESAHKARALLDQAVEALGGQPYLTFTNRSETGRYYPLHHGTSGSLGIPYNYYVEYPIRTALKSSTPRTSTSSPGRSTSAV